MRTYVFVGDTDGDEAWTRTKVTVDFNPLRIVREQVGGCVSPLALMQLQDLKLIAPETLQHFKPEMDPVPNDTKLLQPKFLPFER